MHFQIPMKQWTKIEEYIEKLPQEETEGFKKSDYLDLMEQLVEKYNVLTVCDPREDLKLYSQLVSVLAVLLSHGRKEEWKPQFCKMMTEACSVLSDGNNNVTDFEIPELQLSLSLMKENDTNGDWAKMLSTVESGNVKNVQPDENGMYSLVGTGDSCSVFDDMTYRYGLQLMEYMGSVSDEEGLRRGGVWSLMTQSATGQPPFGGSQESLGQQALLVSILEYEAGKQAEEGNFVLAGRMRRGAHLATLSLREEINRGSVCGEIAVISAAGLCGAVLSVREELPEHPAPCEEGGYVLSSHSKFHQIFANAGGYSIQIDTNGDPTCDATGLGRIQKSGIPESLGLSCPFSKGQNPLSAAIGIGWDDGEGGVQYLSDLTGIKYALSIEEEKADKLKFTITYTGNSLKNCGGIMETYSLDEGGLRYSAKLLESECKAVYARVPLLVSDGERESVIKQKAGQTNVYLEDCRFRITTNASLSPNERMAGNRNGIYQIVTLVHLEPKIRMNLSLCREKEKE